MSNEARFERLQQFKLKLAEMSDDWRVALEREAEFFRTFGEDETVGRGDSVHLVHDWIFPRTFEVGGNRYHNWAIFLTDADSPQRQSLNELFCAQQYVYADKRDRVQREMNQLTLSVSLEEALVDEPPDGADSGGPEFETLVHTKKTASVWNAKVDRVIQFFNSIRLTPSFQDFRDEPMEEALVTIVPSHKTSLVNAHCAVYVMRDGDDQILGAAIVDRSSLRMRTKPAPGSRCIDLLAVGQKNAGHGKLLLAYVIRQEKSRANRASRLYAQAVPVIGSLRFWFARGFRVAGEDALPSATSTMQNMLFEAQRLHCRGLLPCNGARGVELDVPKRSTSPLFVVRANDSWWKKLDQYEDEFREHRRIVQEPHEGAVNLNHLQSWIGTYANLRGDDVGLIVVVSGETVAELASNAIFVARSGRAASSNNLATASYLEVMGAEEENDEEAGEAAAGDEKEEVDDNAAEEQAEESMNGDGEGDQLEERGSVHEATGSSSTTDGGEESSTWVDRLQVSDEANGVYKTIVEMMLQSGSTLYKPMKAILPVKDVQPKMVGTALVFVWEDIVCFDNVFDENVEDDGLSSWTEYASRKYVVSSLPVSAFGVQKHMEVICGGHARYVELKSAFRQRDASDVFVTSNQPRALQRYSKLMVEHLRCLIPEFRNERLVLRTAPNCAKKGSNYVHDGMYLMALLIKRNYGMRDVVVGRFNTHVLKAKSILEFVREDRWERRANDELVQALAVHLENARLTSTLGNDATAKVVKLLPDALATRAHDLGLDDVACLVAEVCNEDVLRKNIHWKPDVIGLGNDILRDLQGRTSRKRIVFVDDNLDNFKAQIRPETNETKYLAHVLDVRVSFEAVQFADADEAQAFLRNSLHSLRDDLDDLSYSQIDSLLQAHKNNWYGESAKSTKVKEEEVFFNPAAGFSVDRIRRLYEWERDELPDGTTWIFDWDYTMVKTAGFLNSERTWKDYAKTLNLPPPHDDASKRAHMAILCGGKGRYQELRKFFEVVGGARVHILTANESKHLIGELFACLCDDFSSKNVHYSEGVEKKTFIAKNFLSDTPTKKKSTPDAPMYSNEKDLLAYLWHDQTVSENAIVGEHQLTVRGVRTLMPQRYVNSDVVDCYFETVLAMLPERLRGHIHYWSNTALETTHEIKRLHKHKNYHVMTNVHSEHWYVCVVDHERKYVWMHDSLDVQQKTAFQKAIFRFLKTNGWIQKTEDYTFLNVFSPRHKQTNVYDCGVHILLRGSRLMLGMEPVTEAKTEEVEVFRAQLATSLSSFCQTEDLRKRLSQTLRELAFGEIDFEHWNPLEGNTFREFEAVLAAPFDGDDEGGEVGEGEDEDGEVGEGEDEDGDGEGREDEDGEVGEGEDEDGEGEDKGGEDHDEGEDDWEGEVVEEDEEEEDEDGEEGDEDENLWSLQNLSSTTASLRNWLRYYMTLHGIYTQQITRTKVPVLMAALNNLHLGNLHVVPDDDRMICIVIHKIGRENRVSEAHSTEASPKELIAVIPYSREWNDFAFYEKNLYVHSDFRYFVRVYLLVRFYRLVRLSKSTIDDANLPKFYRFTNISNRERDARVNRIFDVDFIREYSSNCNVGSGSSSYDLCRVASSPAVFSMRRG